MNQALEQRVERLERLMGIRDASAPDVDAFLYSEEGIREYKHAIRRLKLYRDIKPLEEYTKKTGGRVPRLEGRR